MPVQTNPSIDAGAAIRANVFYALARALEPPGNWGDDLADLLCSALEPLTPPLPELGAQLSGQATEILADREPAAIDHARLFLGPFEILVAPWASFYLEAEPRLMGPSSHYAALAYAEAGLAPGERLKDAPDHVTHELEFMYYLAFNEATSDESGWRGRQTRFWQEHLGRWLPALAEALAEKAGHPFYRTLAETIAAVCACEGSALGAGPPADRRNAETPIA
jgi:TorA maturation chaperone TorD